jgi:hypothetical protein
MATIVMKELLALREPSLLLVAPIVPGSALLHLVTDSQIEGSTGGDEEAQQARLSQLEGLGRLVFRCVLQEHPLGVPFSALAWLSISSPGALFSPDSHLFASTNACLAELGELDPELAQRWGRLVGMGGEELRRAELWYAAGGGGGGGAAAAGAAAGGAAAPAVLHLPPSL